MATTMFPSIFTLYILFVHPLHGMLISPNPSNVLYDLSPFIRVYTNGTIQRICGTGFVPASLIPVNGVRSKDIVISPITARLYLPKIPRHNRKIPLLVYFHGGAFFTESAASPSYHNHLNSLASKSNVIILSVNYRVAPENPLPIGYKDSWTALKWVFSHRTGHGTEPWLRRYVDFSRVSLGGDSAGANIAHNVAIRAGLEKAERIVLDGIFLNCPHFWGKKRIGSEVDPVNGPLASLISSIWFHAYPNSKGLDDPSLNPALDPNISRLGCKRVMIIVAGIDILRDRAIYYNQTLSESGWKGNLKAVEFLGEQHDFGVRFPDRPKAIHMLNVFAYFLNQRK